MECNIFKSPQFIEEFSYKINYLQFFNEKKWEHLKRYNFDSICVRADLNLMNKSIIDMILFIIMNN